MCAHRCCCEYVRETNTGSWPESKREVGNICISPGVVPAMGLDEVHVSVFGQEGHQLVIGPEMEENYLLLTWKHMVRPSWKWNIDFAVQYML